MSFLDLVSDWALRWRERNGPFCVSVGVVDWDVHWHVHLDDCLFQLEFVCEWNLTLKVAACCKKCGVLCVAWCVARSASSGAHNS